MTQSLFDDSDEITSVGLKILCRCADERASVGRWDAVAMRQRANEEALVEEYDRWMYQTRVLEGEEV